MIVVRELLCFLIRERNKWVLFDFQILSLVAMGQRKLNDPKDIKAKLKTDSAHRFLFHRPTPALCICILPKMAPSKYRLDLDVRSINQLSYYRRRRTRRTACFICGKFAFALSSSALWVFLPPVEKHLTCSSLLGQVDNYSAWYCVNLPTAIKQSNPLGEKWMRDFESEKLTQEMQIRMNKENKKGG